MDEFVKFNNQTAGRDKFLRLTQNCCRVLWYWLDKRDTCQNNAAKAKKVDETLGLMRRILRFGRCFETLHSALPVISSIDDQVIRLTSALSRISSSCFMIIDHVVCLHKLGVISNKHADFAAWDKTSSRFWLYSIMMGLFRDFYEVLKIYREEYAPKALALRNRNAHFKKDGIKLKSTVFSIVLVKCMSYLKLVFMLFRSHADVAVDLLKNMCDVFIPLTVLGYLKLSPSTTGCLGIISTIASALPQINPMLKMVPAT